MKPIITLISVAFVLAAASVAQAQQASAVPLQTIAPSPVLVSVHNPYKMTNDEAREF